MLKRLSIFLMFMLLATVSYQQTPLELSFSTSQTAMPGQPFDVDVRVSDFDDLLSTQLFVLWDSTVLEIDTVPFVTMDLQDFDQSAFTLPGQTMSMTKGRLRISWFAFDLVPKNLPDDHLLFTMRFNTIGNECDTTSLAIGDIEDVQIEVIDENFENIGAEANSLPVMIPGNNCGMGTGGGDGVGLIFDDYVTEMGSNICIPMTVENFDTIETFQGSVMWDPSIVSFTGVQNFGLPGLTQGLFGLGDTDNGVLTFLWFDNTGTTPQTLPDGSIIFEVCFDAVGNDGQSSIVKAFDGPTNIQASSPAPIGVRETFVEEGSITIAEDPGAIFTMQAADANGSMNGRVCVDVTTSNFTDISAIQLTMQWDSTILSYDTVENLNPDLQIFANFFNPADADKLRFSWNSLSTQGEDVSDGTLLYSVCFDVIGDCDEVSEVSFIDDIFDIEVIDGNTMVVPDMMIDGSVTVVCGLTCGEPVVTQPRCFGDSNGVISVTISGGTAPYTCEWEKDGNLHSVGTDDNGICLLVGQSNGTYVLTVTDDDGNTCVTSEIEIDDPSPIAPAITVTDADCPDNGSIDIVVLGGTPPYDITWSPEIPDLSDVAIGTYSYLIEDANGCTESGNVEVQCAVNIGVTTTNASECGTGGTVSIDCDGTISIDPAIVSLDNVPAGSYTVTCTDTNGNTSTATFEIDEDPAPAIEVTNINVTPAICGGAAGSVSYNLSGGCEPLMCQRRAIPDGVLEDVSCGSADNLTAGEYELVVTDDIGNTVSAQFTVETEVAEDLDFEVTSVNNANCANDMGSATLNVSGGCAPVTGTLNGNAVSPGTLNLSAGSYTAVFTDALGTSITQSFTIGTNSPAINITEDSNMDGNVSVTASGGSGGFSYLWTFPDGSTSTDEDLTGLTQGGSYVLVVTDSNDCTETLTVDVVGSEVALGSVEVISDFGGFGTPCGSADNDCEGTIDGEILGGTGPYTLTVTDGNTQVVAQDFPITGLCAGVYSVSVVDNDGGSFEVDNIAVTAPTPILIVEDEIDCANAGSADGSISTLVSGGVGGYVYNWQPGGPNGPDNPNVNIGMYILTVTDDNSCTAQMLFEVEDCEGGPDGPCYEGISVMTPNGDGINDLLTISCAGDNPNTLSVFDRYGRLVHSATNYNGSWGGFDLDNELLNEGAYYWVMEILFANGERRVEKGTVTILRNN